MNSQGRREVKVQPPSRSQGNSMAGNLQVKPRPEYCSCKGEYCCSGAELKKILGNDKLAETALLDPKRPKRILANRQSAARSKERKVRYIAELQHKLQTLQAETTLSRRLTLLQRDSAELASHNNELKLRIQAMEQEAQLSDALKVALTLELHRLHFATAEPIGGKVCPADPMRTSNSSLCFVRDSGTQLREIL